MDVDSSETSVNGKASTPPESTENTAKNLNVTGKDSGDGIITQTVITSSTK